MAETDKAYGVMNDPNAKPPKPKPSAKKFAWPSASPENSKLFAASLQELLPEKNWTHADLATAMWGRDLKNNIARNIGKTREWMRATKFFPNITEASYVAQLLGVSLQRLMQPKGDFDPNATPMRKMKPKSEWKTKDKSNGHDTDSRWVRPAGAEPVGIKFESSKKHPTLVALELKGDMPMEVAMAVMSMIASKSADE